MKLAAIDIGSNGARLLIKSFRHISDDELLISRVMYMRIPLRLGADVFTLGRISDKRIYMMKHMLKAFRQIMKLNRVDDYRAYATSATRDAANGKSVLRKLSNETGIKLEAITGGEEARLLYDNAIENTTTATGNVAYIDVGGGSTEISMISDGELVDSYSYKIGTIRMLCGSVEPDMMQKMRQDLEGYASSYKDITIVGSGGNINRLCRLYNDKRKDKRGELPIAELRKLYADMLPMTQQERMDAYGLKADRADVIIPAAEIFLLAAESLGSSLIRVPNISLADCIIDSLYKEKKQTKSKK